MKQKISEALLADAIDELSQDPVLKPLLARYPLCDIRPHKNYFRELVESIIGQQLSVKAAASINNRFLALFGGEFPSAESIFKQPTDHLREAGLSGAKANYVKDLAKHYIDGKLNFINFDSLSNQEIIDELTAVKGIGEWTAHMFLIFCMARPDILPVGDLGIKTGVMRLYNLASLPSPTDINEIADRNGWHPYESIASWYIWRSLENKPS